MNENLAYQEEPWEEKLNGEYAASYRKEFANYDKVHITGGSSGNTDMWGVLRKISGNSASRVRLPHIIVIDSQNMIKFCSVGYTGADLAPLVAYVKNLVGKSRC